MGALRREGQSPRVGDERRRAHLAGRDGDRHHPGTVQLCHSPRRQGRHARRGRPPRRLPHEEERVRRFAASSRRQRRASQTSTGRNICSKTTRIFDTVTLVDAFDDTSMLALGWGLYTGKPLRERFRARRRILGPCLRQGSSAQYEGSRLRNQRRRPEANFFASSCGEAPAFRLPSASSCLIPTSRGRARRVERQAGYLHAHARLLRLWRRAERHGRRDGLLSCFFSDALGCVELQRLVTPMGPCFSRALRTASFVDQGPASSAALSIHGQVWHHHERVSLTPSDSGSSSLRSTSATHIVYSVSDGDMVRWRFDAPHAVVPSTGVRGRESTSSASRTLVDKASQQKRERWADQSLNGDGEASLEPIQPRLQTPWLRVGAMTGYQRTRRFLPAACRRSSKSPSAHFPRSLSDPRHGPFVEHDEGEGGRQSFRFELATLNTLPRPTCTAHRAAEVLVSAGLQSTSLTDRHARDGALRVGRRAGWKTGLREGLAQSKGNDLMAGTGWGSGIGAVAGG